MRCLSKTRKKAPPILTTGHGWSWLARLVVSGLVVPWWIAASCYGQEPPVVTLEVETTTAVAAARKSIRIELPLFTEAKSVREALTRLDEKAKVAKQKLASCGFDGETLKVSGPMLADPLFENSELPTVASDLDDGVAENGSVSREPQRSGMHVFGLGISGEIDLRADLDARAAFETIAKLRQELRECGLTRLGLEGLEELSCSECSDPSTPRLVFVGRLTAEDIGLAERQCLAMAAEKAKRLALAAGKGEVSLVSLRESIRPKMQALPVAVALGHPAEPLLPGGNPSAATAEETTADDLDGLGFLLTLKTTYMAAGGPPE
jgi:hypothetical protein